MPGPVKDASSLRASHRLLRMLWVVYVASRPPAPQGISSRAIGPFDASGTRSPTVAIRGLSRHYDAQHGCSSRTAAPVELVAVFLHARRREINPPRGTPMRSPSATGRSRRAAAHRRRGLGLLRASTRRVFGADAVVRWRPDHQVDRVLGDRAATLNTLARAWRRSAQNYAAIGRWPSGICVLAMLLGRSRSSLC